MRLERLESRFVAYIPAELEPGLLYVSLEYATAVHLCACGCETKTVTPLSPGDWSLVFNGTVTLRPSIGNGQSPCRSHYLITRNQIDWLPPITRSATRAALVRDQRASASIPPQHTKRRWWRRIAAALPRSRGTRRTTRR